MDLKIATWNVNSLRVRLGHVCDWLERTQPDVLAIQETKLRDEDFPVTELAAAGYRAAYSGQAAYNGVALIAREPPTDVATEIDGFEDPQRRLLAATFGKLHVINLYVPNGQSVGSDKYQYKLDWLDALQAHLGTVLAKHEHCVVLGDFNIAPEDRDVHDPAAWEGKVLCSEAERAALRRLLGLGLEDTFRLFEQDERTYSWWDYRAGGFRRNQGLRIDLILATAALSRHCTACRIDKGPRGLERPSDHAPVVAEFSGV
jgi:exodeoxyribonuclease III